MSKRLWTTIILALGLVLLLANMAAAQKSNNLIGTWSFNETWVFWDGGNYGYDSSTTRLLVILNQDNDLFYGTLDGQPIVGNITGNRITATASAFGGVLILNGTLKGSTITGAYNYFKGDVVEAGKFQFIKQ